MLDQHDGDPVGLQRPDQFDADHQFRWIEPREPFVQQQQARFRRERTREFEPLAVDIGEVGRRPPVLSANADAFEQQVDPRLCIGGRYMWLLEREPRPDVLAAVHAVEHADELERPRQSEARDLVRSKTRNVPAHQADGAGIGTQHARHQVERRRLARAVGPEQAHDLALSDVKAEIVDGDQAAEGAPQACDLKNGRVGLSAHAATRLAASPRHLAGSFSNRPATPRGSM